MKLIDAGIDWREDVSNDPVLELLVDEIPVRSEMRFQHDEERGLWYGEKDGFVRFYFWSGPENEGGFGGHNFTIQTVDGEEVTLRGPYSSRSSVMNKVGFGPCVGVRITTDPAVLENGHTFQTGAVTLEVAKQAVDSIEEASHLRREFKYGKEPYWVVVGNGDAE